MLLLMSFSFVFIFSYFVVTWYLLDFFDHSFIKDLLGVSRGSVKPHFALGHVFERTIASTDERTVHIFNEVH